MGGGCYLANPVARVPKQLGDAYLQWVVISLGRGGLVLDRVSPLFDVGLRLPGLLPGSPSRLWSSWGGGSFWSTRGLGRGTSTEIGL